MSKTTTFDSLGTVVPAVIVSDPDENGNVVLHASEGDSDAVKAFTAKKAPEGHGSDYVQA